MNRGYAYVLESMGLFVAWMLILSALWSTSEFTLNHENKQREWEKKEVELIQWTDILLLQHHVNPWNGCARYSEEKRRVLPYMGEKACFLSLAHTDPPYSVTYVTIQTTNEKIAVFGKKSTDSSCVGVRRPFLLDEKENAVLEVGVCEK